MIDFTLRCRDGGHRFGGWFRSGADFERQTEAGLVTCPMCGSASVEKALMAPAVASGSRDAGPGESGGPGERGEAQAAPMAGIEDGARDVAGDSNGQAASPEQTSTMPEQAEVYRKLQALAREVRKRSDYVGSRFAEEARRIHDGESDKRAIYGEASREEAESLRADGIDAVPLPPLPEDGH